MATAPLGISLWLRSRFQPPRPLLTSISKRLLSNLHQPQPSSRLDLVHRVNRPLAISSLPTTAGVSKYNRPFVSSPPQAGEEVTPAPELSLQEWDKLSDERKLQLELDGNTDKWGWVVFRTTYKPELAQHWESFKRALDEQTRKEIAESDAPEIAERLEWVFIEDPALEGASRDDLRERFKQWARAENPEFSPQPTKPPPSTWRRYLFFIQVDEASLRSLVVRPGLDVSVVKDHYPNEDRPVSDAADPATGVNIGFEISGWVNLVYGWLEPDLEYAAQLDDEEKRGDIWTESWMRISVSMLRPYFYIMLDDFTGDSWYVWYQKPPDVVMW